MIATWLAGKVSGIIIFCIACLSVVLLPMVVVQTTRIDGLDLGGWYAVKGYKPLYEAALLDVTTLRGNNAALSNGLNTCNASVDALAKAGKDVTAAAQALIAARAQDAAQLQSRIKAIAAVKSTGETCPVAEAILRAGFQ